MFSPTDTPVTLVWTPDEVRRFKILQLLLYYHNHTTDTEVKVTNLGEHMLPVVLVFIECNDEVEFNHFKQLGWLEEQIDDELIITS